MGVCQYEKVNMSMGTFLAVQWLGLHASTAGGTGLVPAQRIKMSCGGPKILKVKIQCIKYIKIKIKLINVCISVWQ